MYIILNNEHVFCIYIQQYRSVIRDGLDKMYQLNIQSSKLWKVDGKCTTFYSQQSEPKSMTQTIIIFILKITHASSCKVIPSIKPKQNLQLTLRIFFYGRKSGLSLGLGLWLGLGLGSNLKTTICLYSKVSY